MTRVIIVILLSVSITGCGVTAFSLHFRDNNATDLKIAMKTIKGPTEGRPKNNLGLPMVFIVTKDPTSIVAYDIANNKVMWTVKADVTSRVIVGKRQIFHREGKSTLVGRSITNGRKRWSTSIIGGNQLVGVTTDGTDLYYVSERVSRSTSGESAYLVSLNGNSGSKRWVQSSSGRLGAPIARGNRVLVPLRFQSLAIVNSKDGIEIARIRSKQETLLWVRSSQAGIVYGGKTGVYQLNEKSITGTKKGSSFIAPTLPQSVRMAFWWDGYNAALSNYTAYDRKRLLWQLDPKGEFLQDTIYVHNYRFFFAFDSTSKNQTKSSLRWAYSFPRHDVVASVHTGKSLVLLTDNGHLIVIDPKVGVPVKEESLKLKIRGATFDALGYTAGEAKGISDLRATLSKIIWDPDKRFGPVKLFCVEELARLPGGEVSRDLVRIVTHEDIDKVVYKRAGDVIVSRHDKKAIPLYLATLKSHYNFFKNTKGMAVDIMARALGDLKVKAAVKPLLKHLADHETSHHAVKEIVKALAAIGDKAILDPFRDFLLTYRCDPQFAKNPEALQLVAKTLLKMGGVDERQLLSFVENDPYSLKSLRTYLAEALRQTGTKLAPRRKKTEPEKKTTQAQ